MSICTCCDKYVKFVSMSLEEKVNEITGFSLKHLQTVNEDIEYTTNEDIEYTTNENVFLVFNKKNSKKRKLNNI